LTLANISVNYEDRPKTMGVFTGTPTGNATVMNATSKAMSKRDSTNCFIIKGASSKQGEQTPDDMRRTKLILNDGETRDTKLLVNPINWRNKSDADTKVKQRHQYDALLQRNLGFGAYKQGLDLNAHGTSRKSYLSELAKKRGLWVSNPNLIESFQKVKNTCEFKKEYPKIATCRADYTKYGTENFNYHAKSARGGYSRHERGYSWHYN